MDRSVTARATRTRDRRIATLEEHAPCSRGSARTWSEIATHATAVGDVVSDDAAGFVV